MNIPSLIAFRGTAVRVIVLAVIGNGNGTRGNT